MDSGKGQDGILGASRFYLIANSEFLILHSTGLEMLVYLDSAHFALLERLYDEDQINLTQFVKQWNDRGIILALSLNHAQEIAQIDTEINRNRRINCIGLFPCHNIRYSPRGSLGLLELEIHSEILSVLGKSPLSVEEIQEILFVQMFQDFASVIIDNISIFQDSYLLRRTTSKIQNTLKIISRELKIILPTNSRKTCFNDPNFDWSMFDRIIFSMLPPGCEGTQAGQFLIAFISGMNERVKQKKNIQKAFEDILGLNSLKYQPPIEPQDQVAVAEFISTAWEVIIYLANRYKIPTDHLARILPMLHPYKIPGYSLGIAVERARQLSGNQASAGDMMDAAHIAFAPYVDILFVDKRTLTYLRQELRDRPNHQISPSDGRICSAGTIDELRQQLGF